MMNELERLYQENESYEGLRDKALLFSNMPFILDKLEGDGNLGVMFGIIANILEKEIAYAVQGELSRTWQ